MFMSGTIREHRNKNKNGPKTLAVRSAFIREHGSSRFQPPDAHHLPAVRHATKKKRPRNYFFLVACRTVSQRHHPPRCFSTPHLNKEQSHNSKHSPRPTHSPPPTFNSACEQKFHSREKRGLFHSKADRGDMVAGGNVALRTWLLLEEGVSQGYIFRKRDRAVWWLGVNCNYFQWI